MKRFSKYILILCLLGTYLVLLLVYPETFQKLLTKGQIIYYYALGYLVSAGGGYVVTLHMSRYLVERYRILRPKGDFLPALLGVFERILYTSVLLAGIGEFIIFWPLTKAAAGWVWQVWQREEPKGGNEGVHIYIASKYSDPKSPVRYIRKDGARAHYNIHLISTLLSIAFGALVIWELSGGKVRPFAFIRG